MEQMQNATRWLTRFCRYFRVGLLRSRKMVLEWVSWVMEFITRGILARIVNTDKLQT